MPARRSATAALLAAAALLGVPEPAGAQVAPALPAAQHVAVTVDRESPRRVKSVVGLLQGASTSLPESRWIDRLRPALWRGTPEGVPLLRAARAGARFELVVSDLWGYPGLDWYGRVAPWRDLDAWRGFVTDLARRYGGRGFVWDVWNEPDREYSWTGTRAQFHETYRVAAQAIRAAAGPGETIAGPSVSAFRRGWLSGLVGFCADRGCAVDALTWHEFADGTSIIAISRHARSARALLRSPAGAAVGLRSVEVNEVGGRGDALLPGEQVAYLDQLERGRVDAAARACWQDPSGTNTCRESTLDGLLDSDTRRPRAVWWVLEAYGAGVRSRVASRSGHPALAVLAARRGRGAQVLLGSFDGHDRHAPGPLAVDLRVRGLASSAVTVTVTRIPAGGEAAMTPEPEPSFRLAVDGGAVSVRLPPIALHEAMVVRLS